jgi:hypothetical protein
VPTGAGLSVEHNKDPCIYRLFPLHNEKFNQFVLNLWKKGTEGRTFVSLLRRHFGEVRAPRVRRRICIVVL